MTLADTFIFRFHNRTRFIQLFQLIFFIHAHQIGVKVLDNKLYLNPGSISGAFSNVVADPSPSFILMVLTGNEAVIYLYVLNDRTQKFDVNKVEFQKGEEKYRIINDNDNENDNQEGYCNKKVALSFKAEKTLVSATSTGNTIILTEEVKYKAGENLDLPNYLKSGTYRYTFRLDKNYNYVLISKTHETQY